MDERVEDDASLVAAVLGGDKSAFVRLVRRHEGPAKAVAFAVSQSATVMEDVMQESYLKAFRSLGRYRTKDEFRPWLLRIVRNTAIDELRKRKAVVSLHPEQDVRPDPPALEAIDAAASRIDLRQALTLLSEPQRVALLLVDGEQVPYKEAAEIIGVPQGTVATRVKAAREALRSALGEPGSEGS